jgi:hypothetical protein
MKRLNLNICLASIAITVAAAFSVPAAAEVVYTPVLLPFGSAATTTSI